MAKWLNSIDVSETFRAAVRYTTPETVSAACKDIIAKLEEIPPLTNPYDEEEKGFIIIAFQNIIDTEPDDNGYEFDEVLDRLYDWGDTDLGNSKLCWIRTL